MKEKHERTKKAAKEREKCAAKKENLLLSEHTKWKRYSKGRNLKATLGGT